jgi:basic membrane protein A
VLVQQHLGQAPGKVQQRGGVGGSFIRHRAMLAEHVAPRRGSAPGQDTGNHPAGRGATLAILNVSFTHPQRDNPTMKHAVLAALGLSLAASLAQAQPAVIYDMGGKFDKSFNEAAYRGAEQWKKETGKPYLDFEISNEAQRDQALRRMADKGANPVIGVGFSFGSTFEKVAKDYPKLQFAIIDSVVKAPNIESVVFKEQEGSFLVGMMAAIASKSGKVGFVGGMDIPLIRKFQCGYEQGARYANPKVELNSAMTGTTASAWNDPTRGAELAKAQFAKGVDVVFAAAGGTGIGVYQAAKDAGKLAIGVDSNQNHLQPGTMLTSMVKRVDVAVYNLAKKTTPGLTLLGLKEGGVDYALDQYNEKLVSADMKKKVDAAKADIIAGKIKVADYMADNACKY